MNAARRDQTTRARPAGRSTAGRGSAGRGAGRESAAEARAEFEAQREANRARRETAMRERYGDTVPGRAIMLASWASTLVFSAVALLAVLDPDRFIGLFFAVSVGLFFAGCGAFALVLVLAAARSRDDAMGIGGLFFLAGSAPRPAQRQLLGSLAVQVLVAVVAAALDPFTPLAFGTLVPVLPLALAGLWAVRHGLFEPARPDS
jgi:hypothetical protein